MQIKIFKGLEKTEQMRGMGVVIDVFRATSTIACLIKSKAKRIIVLPDANQIKHYTKKDDFVCFSEVVSEGFDNSPITALRTLLIGKTAVISTTSGTKAIIAAKNCNQVITASFLNFDAVINYILEINPTYVSILAAGTVPDKTETIEDTLCAEAIRNRLLGIDIDEHQIKKMLLDKIENRKKYVNLNNPIEYEKQADFLFCTNFSILEVIPKVVYNVDFIEIVNAQKT